jgi:hypothetical protein
MLIRNGIITKIGIDLGNPQYVLLTKTGAYALTRLAVETMISEEVEFVHSSLLTDDEREVAYNAYH